MSMADLEPISIISSWLSEDFDDWIMYQDVDQILIHMNQYHQKVNIYDHSKDNNVYINNESKSMIESQLKRYANIHIEQLTEALDQNWIQDYMTRMLELEFDQQYKIHTEPNESHKCCLLRDMHSLKWFPQSEEHKVQSRPNEWT